MNSDILKKWKSELSEKLNRSEDEIVQNGLTAYDFSPSKSIEIAYSSTSVIKFDHAFMVINSETRVAAVFTEHYGYHEFSVYGAIAKEIEEQIYIDDGYDPDMA